MEESTEEEMDGVFYLCRFNPEPAEAVTYYLPRLLPGSPLPLPRGLCRLIHRADVYALPPADLAASFPPAPKAESTGDRFFLTPRRRIPGRRGSRRARVAGEGTWVTQKTREVREDGAKVGELRSLSFKKVGKEDAAAATGWVMEEYRCLLPQAAFAGGEMVLCKIHLSRNATSAARQESAAYLLHRQEQEQEQEQAEPVSAHAAPNTKRAAPVAADPPSPKKTRVAAPLPVPFSFPAAGGSRFTCSMEELLGGGLAAQEAPPVGASKGVDEFAASLEGFPKQYLAASGSDEVSSSSMAAGDGGDLLGRCRNRPQPIIFPLSQLEGYNDFFSCAGC